ncbi:Uncharacterised protein [Legionella pneumophila]|uniref:Uncharacterized protein n=4 Tax=Legionellaceae TaxID=444 RepID=A0A377IVF9_9GAMM|nr:hypothetical protein ULM_34810 [Legionella pneumophila]OEH45223.1 hypothetical protein lpari_03845 [Legionella parisiensis]QMT61976.1 hypothetical protein HBNCFIEN_03384 [Legionella sp. PC997]SIR40736.1 hypothetical protein SAMN05421777_111129 [Fluoribacter gormanii]STO91401.1 Uncharacterised protein [Fluoribacter dumoffii]STX92055.1 Uncharacterised protein [Legionella gratiana]
MELTQQKRLLSHVISPEKMEHIIQKITERIKCEGDKPSFLLLN